MKKNVARWGAAVLAVCTLFSCGKKPDAETDTPSPVPPAVSPAGREDREILPDYQNIVPSGAHEVRILFANAGKADSMVLQIDEKTYLLDTGTAMSPAKLLPAFQQMGVERFDGVFLTHTDNDHVGGLEALRAVYPMEVCYTSSISMDWDKVERLRGDVPRVALDPGAVVPVTDGVWFQVLGPIRYDPLDDNDNSLVLRLEVNGRTLLFTGDMKEREEKTLLAADMPLEADLLKVGHHGRRDATSADFLHAVSPELAVISTDREIEDKTAHQDVLDALEEAGAAVYITDESVLGYQLTLPPDGAWTVEALEPLEKAADVRLERVSKEEQLVVLENREDHAVDLSGWYLLSETGKEVFRFPDGASVEAGGTVRVACNGMGLAAEYYWGDSRVWHKTKKDRAVLVDCFGNTVDQKNSK